jgi:magnesium and cobalt transporter
MNQKLENEDNHPPSGFISRIKKFFRNPFFIKTQSVSEVTDFLKDAVDLNIIDKEAESIANKAIRLGNTTVKEIMVPKVDMVTFGINDEINVILEKIIESGHSRYPILGSERDEVSGILLAKDMLPKIYEGNNNFSLSGMLREPNIVPETKKADSLLEEFKKDRSHMAVVIDEYGTISGLVTIEDILEELVGEIEDEHDVDEEEIIRISDKKFYADAKVEIEEFTEFFNLDVDPLAIDAETLGGFVISKLGVLPKVGDKVKIEDLTIKVIDADDRKIDKVQITKNQ